MEKDCSETCCWCRAFLAKGLVLKDIGRKGDAQRMFLQAR